MHDPKDTQRGRVLGNIGKARMLYVRCIEWTLPAGVGHFPYGKWKAHIALEAEIQSDWIILG